MSGRIHATYLLETAYEVEQAVAVIAGEQSSGTFVTVPGETPELRARFGARVESIELLGTANQPSLPGAGAPTGAWRRVRFELS